MIMQTIKLTPICITVVDTATGAPLYQNTASMAMFGACGCR